jgi:hypothetical protein
MRNLAQRLAEALELPAFSGGGRMGFRPEEKGIKT